MKRPAFQFYPDNWRNNANLRRCSWAARGVWIEVMCLMHDSDRYGVLEWPLKEIAQALGCTTAPLKELVEKSVLKGCDKGGCEPFVYVPRSGRRDGAPVTLIEPQAGPIWFSSRMLKDEYKRIARGEADSNGDSQRPTPKPPPKPAPNPPFGAAPNPHIGPYAGAPPSPSPSPTPSSNTDPRALSAGEACKAMKGAGIQSVSPSDPRLLALLQAGATVGEFSDVAAEAIAKGISKPFPWVLTTIEGRRRDAAKVGTLPPRPPAPEPAWRTEQRERMQQAAPYAVSRPRASRAPSTPIDPEVSDVLPLERPVA